jgi:hypothetical protein
MRMLNRQSIGLSANEKSFHHRDTEAQRKTKPCHSERSEESAFCAAETNSRFLGLRPQNDIAFMNLPFSVPLCLCVSVVKL